MLRPMRRPLTAPLALAWGALACASTPAPDPRYRPAENVLEVVAVLRAHVGDDTYRFEPARDFTGRNVYRSSLLRLESLERVHTEALHAGHLDGVIAFVGSLLYIPRGIAHTPPASLLTQLAVLKQPRLLLVYAMTALGYGGTFTAFTFLAPILQELSGFSAGAVSLVLLVYGVSVAVGNVWGGKLADQRGPIAALKLIFALLAGVLLLLGLTADNPWLALGTVLLWGAVAFGNVPGLQLYVVRQAEHFSPQAVDVASGLNIAAFNLGIAGGAWLGGHIVAQLGLIHTAWIGALVVLGALALTAWSGRLDSRNPALREAGTARSGLVVGH